MNDGQDQPLTPASEPVHTLSPERVLAALGTDVGHGLTSALATQRVKEYGPNELAQAPLVPLWKKFLGQFQGLVIWILIAAAILAGLLGAWADTLAILAIVLLNGFLGFLQEERAERALTALKKLSAPLAKVIRDGALQSLPARELVPGDRVELEAGDHIPADVRLIKTFSFSTQEAALTGESVPVEKDAGVVLSAATPLGDRRNLAYLGTVAAAGKASAVVIATGMSTELGRIAALLEGTAPEPTPLQRRLAELGRVLIVVCLGLVGIIFVLQVLRGGKVLEVLLLAVSLAVAAVPEGLPAVVTIALALGLQRMVRRNALVRKLPSVETLGSVTVICSDKTGTLTRNEMTVREISAGGAHYQVTGVGYEPHGQFLKSGTPIEPGQDPDLVTALTIAARCNNARLSPRGDEEEDWQVIGDPTEGALLVAALKAEIEPADASHHVVLEIPFDSERKAMSVIVRGPGGETVMYTKGASEVILSKCVHERHGGKVEPLTEARRGEVAALGAEMAARALRVLALAYQPDPRPAPAGYEESGLIFAGLVGMIDPPRDEAKEAVRRCHDAGIRPVMITGDHPATAQAIALELHIAAGGAGVVTGADLDALADDALAERVERIAVYARVSAEHKLRVVRAWKRRGEIVAMTGDGVNDAPAVKAADIGIAMGVTGTDVTKEASDIVLTDDNFASIVNAVEEGRGIFDNIQKFLHYLLSSNASEVLFMFAAALLDWPAPLLAIQLLWINLVTDSLPALALGMEPPEPDLMQRKPRPPHEPIITWHAGLRMLLHGSLLAAVALVAFAAVYAGDPDHLPRARTVAFCTLAYAQLFFSFACRSHCYTMPKLGLFSNPQLFAAIAISGLLQLSVVTLPLAQPIFGTAAHPTWEWLLVLGLALTPVTIIEVAKLLRAWLAAKT